MCQVNYCYRFSSVSSSYLDHPTGRHFWRSHMARHRFSGPGHLGEDEQHIECGIVGVALLHHQPLAQILVLPWHFLVGGKNGGGHQIRSTSHRSKFILYVIVGVVLQNVVLLIRKILIMTAAIQ